MYYAYTTPLPPRSHGAWLRFSTELDRDEYVSQRPETRRPCDPPEDTTGFRAACGREMKLDV